MPDVIALPATNKITGLASIDHAAIPMQAVDAMLAFYAGLGCDIREEHPGFAYSANFGNNKINLHTPHAWQDVNFSLRGHTAVPGCGDFCFVWNATREALLQLLADLGAAVEEGPVQRRGGRGEGSSIYTRDPDRNLLEFIIYPA